MDLPSSSSEKLNIRARLDNLALKLLDEVGERFQEYATELGAIEWAKFDLGEVNRYVSCFSTIVDNLILAHVERGYAKGSIAPAVFACITSVIDTPRFDDSRGPEYNSRPKMPATYPWMTSTLFENEGFRSALRQGISTRVSLAQIILRHNGEEIEDQKFTLTEPLGPNPFAPEHPAHAAFQEATWKAKQKIGTYETQLLSTKFESARGFLDAVALYREQWFNICAFEATLFVADEETAKWYERWIGDLASFLLQDTMAGSRLKDPKADLDAAPPFSSEDLTYLENHLMLELMKMCAHYKTKAAERVLEVVRLQKAASPYEPISAALSSPSLAGVPASKGGRKRKLDPGIVRLKLEVRKLRADGLTHKEICDRLGNADRPPHAKWRHLSWPLAYKRSTPAVAKWLSEACSDLPSLTI